MFFSILIEVNFPIIVIISFKYMIETKKNMTEKDNKNIVKAFLAVQISFEYCEEEKNKFTL